MRARSGVMKSLEVKRRRVEASSPQFITRSKANYDGSVGGEPAEE